MPEYSVSLSLEEALERILPLCHPVETEEVALEEAGGRVLAEDITAQENIPPFCRSPYDGYALRAADTQQASKERGICLRIIEEIPAGHAPVHSVGPQQAAKILTGAPIPEGANAVVKFEDTNFDQNTVQIFEPCRSGQNIVPAGEDIKKDSLVMKKGDVLDGARLGLLAGLGYATVKVHCRPRVALLSTGDELVPKEAVLTPGKIRNSSVYALSFYVERSGAACRYCGIVPDQAERVAEELKKAAAHSDLILTTGGASVGDYDVMRSALALLDAQILFWKLQIKPGSAFVAALYQGKLILCLSGNPSAAAVALFLVGIPALRKLSGRRDVQLKKLRVKLGYDFPKRSPVRRFLPGKLAVREAVVYLDQDAQQGNGMIHPLQDCTLLGEIPAGSDAVAAGTFIDAYFIFA